MDEAKQTFLNVVYFSPKIHLCVVLMVLLQVIYNKRWKGIIAYMWIYYMNNTVFCSASIKLVYAWSKQHMQADIYYSCSKCARHDNHSNWGNGTHFCTVIPLRHSWCCIHLYMWKVTAVVVSKQTKTWDKSSSPVHFFISAQGVCLSNIISDVLRDALCQKHPPTLTHESHLQITVLCLLWAKSILTRMGWSHGLSWDQPKGKYNYTIQVNTCFCVVDTFFFQEARFKLWRDSTWFIFILVNFDQLCEKYFCLTWPEQ